MIAEALAGLFLTGLIVTLLRLRVQDRRVDRLEGVRSHLRGRNDDLRAELDQALGERDAAITEVDRATLRYAALAKELERSKQWSNELREASIEQDSYLMNPHPRRNRVQRHYDQQRHHFNTLWNAQLYEVPPVIPPHEQTQQDGDCE